MDTDWQLKFKQISERGQYLFETEKWTDCWFLVGTAPNNKLTAAHKFMLAMASPVFERMFYGNFPNEEHPIVISDVQPDAFLAMLEYIYTDEINITSLDEACELYYVTKKYMLPHVVEQCTKYILNNLSPKNACRMYEFAKLFEEQQLMEKCMEIISFQTKYVLADSSFNDVEISTFLAILDQEKLNIDSELDLFDALLKYANERGMHTKCDTQPKLVKGDEEKTPVDVKAKQKAKNLEGIKKESNVSTIVHDQENNSEESSYATTTDVDGDINCKMNTERRTIDEALIRQAVKKIRFLTLTPMQFSGPACSKLLLQDEALAIFINISNPLIKNYEMPDGFSSLRKVRYFDYKSYSSKSYGQW